MPEFIIGARGHDFGRQTPEALFSAIGQAGFRCTQLAFTKAVSYTHLASSRTLMFFSTSLTVTASPFWKTA